MHNSLEVNEYLVKANTQVRLPRGPHDHLAGGPFHPTVESRFGQKRGFGETPGKLLTISKPNHYLKCVNPAERKGVTKPNL